ncbi:hypothetical protein SDC9_151833 [bioreactor metagenome]|uniref:Uncharacterized protein n=1 Tax=bioreactor metagenome TaxID=1076179 RepID=A0A645ETP7_9ZZZZ
MFSHFDGTSLRPYRVHNGMAFFCMKEGFVLGEIYGNVITLTECLIEVDYKRSEIILIKERIWHNPYEQISIAGVKYPDLCKALIQRAAMKYIPDQPIYFDSFGV